LSAAIAKVLPKVWFVNPSAGDVTLSREHVPHDRLRALASSIDKPDRASGRF
jgi:hypothetical protein